MYSDGDIQISKTKLDSFIQNLPKGKYSTFDLLEKYQGIRGRNKGINVSDSWNASFGRILKQCANSNNFIVETKKGSKITVDEGDTTTSTWEIK